MIINPFCEFCSKEFKQLLKLNKSSKDFLISIIFTKSIENGSTLHLIELYYKLSNDEYMIALGAWFETKNKSQFKKTFPLEISEIAINTLEEHSLWCFNSKVFEKPLIIFNNNNKLSNYYSIDELVNILNEK